MDTSGDKECGIVAHVLPSNHFSRDNWPYVYKYHSADGVDAGLVIG